MKIIPSISAFHLTLEGFKLRHIESIEVFDDAGLQIQQAVLSYTVKVEQQADKGSIFAPTWFLSCVFEPRSYVSHFASSMGWGA